MTRMVKSKFRTIGVAAALACVLALTGPAGAEKWSFGVMGDTQWVNSDMGVNNVSGTNSVAMDVIRAVNNEFIRQHVDFVVQVGDLCDTQSNAALQSRIDANATLTAHGIAFYGLRGNHENNATSLTFFRNNYIPGTTGYTNSSVNLPGVQVSTDGATGNYSVTYNGIKIVMLDITVAESTANMTSATAWMNTDLANSTYDHAFVFSHKNLLGQNHKDNLFGTGTTSANNEANTNQQNAFFQALASNGVRYTISGHDHMHHRSLVRSPNYATTGNQVNQLICASDSTKFYNPADGYSTRETPLAQQLGTIGYYIFTIDGDQVTIDYYATQHQGTYLANGNIVASPNWTRVETFGYSTSGRSFLVNNGANFHEWDESPFLGTLMTLSGTNTNLTTQGGGPRALSREINIGWAAGTGDCISDVLTIWGMEDINGQTTGVPVAPTALPFELTLGYDADLYTEVYMMWQDREGDWHVLDNYTDNGDGTMTATVMPGGWGVFALGGTAVVPEPATLTLLALGGLTLIRRRNA